ncbi:MAG: InlB B-repeat-containing protein, partial [Lachnospiraceae bacterium]|nr:InlB B-repeat-containing protein [Lachnospiraceae bacterium]
MKIFRKFLSIFLALVLVATTFSPAGSITARAAGDYTVTLHSNVPGNDETMSGEIGENAVVHFLRYAAVALGWIGDDMADKSLDYNAYFGKNPGHVVSGWNTRPDGTGTAYYPGDEFTMPAADVDLYAQWEDAWVVTTHTNTGTADDFDMTYDVPRGGQIQIQPETDGFQYAYIYDANGVNYSNGGNAYGTLHMSGYSLSGFSEDPSGNGQIYGRYEAIYPSGNMDLYMIWQKAVTVTLHENAPSSNQTATVSGNGTFYASYGHASFGGNTVSFTFSNPGYIIVGWNTKADGTGTNYSIGETFEVTADMDLYAVWQKAFTVTLYENTPSSNQTATVSGIGNVYASSTYASFGENSVSYDFTNPGYALVSWNTKADGTGTSYRVNDYFEITADTDLYAIWAKAYTVTFHDNAGGSTETIEGCGKFSVSNSSASFNDLGRFAYFDFQNPGYTLLSWNTKADGSGTQYCFYRDFEVTADMDLYAVWGQNCTLTLHGDVDGSGNEVTATAEIAVGTTLYATRYDTTRSVASQFPGGAFQNSASLGFTRTDAAFAGWKDAAGNNVGSRGELCTVTGDTDLYADLTTDIITITYDFGDPNLYGAPETRIIARGDEVAFLWNGPAIGYAADLASGDWYDRRQIDEGQLTAEEDTTLFAIRGVEYTSLCKDADSDFYYYMLNNGTAVIKKYDGPVTDVRIPETVDGIKVSAYDYWTAFQPLNWTKEWSPIESLVYPDYIPHCLDNGESAGGTFDKFRFSKLTSVRFENGIPEIADYEFTDQEIDGYYPDTWTTVPPATFGGAKHINWIPYHVQEEETTPVMRVDHQTTAPDEVTVNGEPVDPENYTVVIEGDTVIIEFTESYKESLPPGAEIGVSYGDDTITAEVEEEGMALAVLSVENQEQTVPQGQTAEPVVIVVSGDVEKLEKVLVGGVEAVVGTDVFVTDGSTVLTFSEAFLASLPTDTPLEVEAVFSNGVARTEIAVNTPEPSWDDLFDHSVSFSNDLKLIYYVDASALEGYENVRVVGKRVKADKNWETFSITKYEIQATNTGEEYRFVLGGIAAKEIGDVVTVHLEAEKNGETRKSPSDVYSVKQYAYNRLRKTEKAHFKTLLVDMLNYCAQAQEYFGYDTEHPVNADLTDEERALGTQETPELTNIKEITALEGATAEWAGTNVIFGSNVGLKYYFTVDEYEIIGLNLKSQLNQGFRGLVLFLLTLKIADKAIHRRQYAQNRNLSAER